MPPYRPFSGPTDVARLYLSCEADHLTLDIAIVLATLAATVVLVISDRIRLDLVALLTLLTLLAAGSITTSEAAASLGDTIGGVISAWRSKMRSKR
jgi:hypothetical protein